MTAIIIATRHEASVLIRKLSAVKDSGIFHYRGPLLHRNVALYVCRPGVASKEQLRRFLRLYRYERAVLAGCSASLSAALTHLQVVHVAQAVAPGEKMLTLAGSGMRAVSVRHLVSDDTSKADLRAQTEADVLDMETYTVSQIMAEPEFAALPFRALRIVDDLPSEENYLKKERMLREVTMRTANGNMSLAEILRFGLWDYLQIQLRRRRVAAAIYRSVAGLLAGA